MNDIITIIKQQIDRGLKILLSLNDLEEEDGSPLHYRVNLFEGQKFYDENELNKLETKVRNWQSETETCLILHGFKIGEDNPLRRQLVGMDKRGDLANDIQYGLCYLNEIIDKYNILDQPKDIRKLLNKLIIKEEKDFCSYSKGEDLSRDYEYYVEDKAFSDKTGLPCFTNKQMGIFLRAIAEITEAPNPPAKTTLGEVVEKIAGYKATTVNQNMKGATSESDKEIVAKAIESKLPNLAAKVRKL